MAEYVYLCPVCKLRRPVEHSMLAEHVELCSCGARMGRVPQAFRWYMDPVGVIYDELDAQYRKARARKRARVGG